VFEGKLRHAQLSAEKSKYLEVGCEGDRSSVSQMVRASIPTTASHSLDLGLYRCIRLRIHKTCPSPPAVTSEWRR
jgi:hypothetical protein